MKKFIKSKFPFIVYAYRIVVGPFVNAYKKKNEKRLIKTVVDKQKAALSKLRNKEQLNCIFFVVSLQGWKYESVYRAMEKNDRFNPIILICPVINYGYDVMLRHLNENLNFFKAPKYNVFCSYDTISGKYLDAKELNPDIIIYTNPYKGLIDNRYYISNFTDFLTVYMQYTFDNNIDYEFFHDELLHNLVWRFYMESDEHLEYSKNYSRSKGRNCVTTGYPGIETLIDSHIPTENDWKVTDKKLKKIIWAPHHTIEPVRMVNYSCFLEYADFMLEMAEKYKNEVQFVFKPHPLLRDKLYLYWGKEKTNDYFCQWENKSNCNFNDGAYADLFLTSDAMIHDSGSFIIEYLYVNKPVMRTLNNIPIKEMYNPFALKCLDQHYFARSKEDVELFIKDVIKGIDPLKEQRSKFVADTLMPKGKPSQNIIDDILDSIDNQILYRN